MEVTILIQKKSIQNDRHWGASGPGILGPKGGPVENVSGYGGGVVVRKPEIEREVKVQKSNSAP